MAEPSVLMRGCRLSRRDILLDAILIDDMLINDMLQFETNIDDMDPRLWPHVIDQLLAAGANDAWTTPIVMKKGRPAFTLAVLCSADAADAVLATIFRETTTIGVREMPIRRHALERQMSTVEVHGHQIGIKTAYLDGEAVNRSVEWDDVVAAASALDLPAHQVVALATEAGTHQAGASAT